jgi:hypothetical protein
MQFLGGKGGYFENCVQGFQNLRYDFEGVRVGV